MQESDRDSWTPPAPKAEGLRRPDNRASCRRNNLVCIEGSVSFLSHVKGCPKQKSYRNNRLSTKYQLFVRQKSRGLLPEGNEAHFLLGQRACLCDGNAILF